MFYQTSMQARVYTMCASDPGLVNSGYTITNGQPINDNPEAPMPWLSVWPGQVNLLPVYAMAGNPGGWHGTAEILIYHQQATWQAPPIGLNKLTAARDYIISLVHSNLTLDGMNLLLQRVEAELVDSRAAEDESTLFTDGLRLTYNIRNQ